MCRELKSGVYLYELFGYENRRVYMPRNIVYD